MRARGAGCGIDQPRSVTAPSGRSGTRSNRMPKSPGVVVSPGEGKKAMRDSIARTVTASAAMTASEIRRIFRALAGDALVVVLRAELLEQRHRFGERLDALHRAVGHVGGRPPLARDRLDVGALRHQVLD